ncbi:cyclic nucleotide-binding domain protein (macronuclear) [Tetrahymena thermophila SB210]|uniref:Cyclic nucleotide-binding domain protein n=1 Tax=Tetrahymena thermophila (strain SB210) TaxID=312017 RepID=I7LTI4_TETTS|nr:cyclic nucleotide-binding domain protein [Tetrahymena thermophila SB210]EAR85304.1 cyclic nucleotide-binding domain protein [Tetrahymena thermophila SB210]|eukprot:XP_001032967.1 cyclic nucleotide-binding domain protein [Tetrahymena thermophila SB210]
MDEFYTKCLEIGKANKIKESQTQLSQFLRKNSYFRPYEKTNTNLDLYTRNYSQFLRYETFQIGKIIYTISPPKQFYIIQGRALVVTPKRESSQLLFNNYIERVVKKIKKGNFRLDEEDEDCPSKDYYKNQLILKPGDGFGELQYTRSVIIAIDELNVFTCLSNHYQKCFELILTRNTFITECLNKILPLVEKNEIANDIAPQFVEHSICSFEDIFKRNEKISYFYLLRQGFCEVYIDQADTQESDYQKSPSISIKQGDLFGHEDCTGSSNLRVFSCRSISPNTVIYAIDKEALMNNKNQKIRSLILNNAFSKYHYYMQNFKSKGLQIRQEKNIMVRTSQTNLSNLSQQFLPAAQNQPTQSTPIISLSSTQKQEKIFQSPQNQKVINSARLTMTSEKFSSETKNSLNQSQSNFKINTFKSGFQSNLDNKSLIQNQQKKGQSQIELRQIPKQQHQLISPKVNQDMKVNIITNNSQQIQHDKKAEPEIVEDDKIAEKSEKKSYPENQKNNINLQANIDYIKSLRVSNEAHKFKNSSILSFFSPQQPNSNTSLTHLDETMEETEKSKIASNQQNVQKFQQSNPSNFDNRQSSITGEDSAINSKVTRNFKLLNEIEDLDSSTSIANDLDTEDEIFKRNLYGMSSSLTNKKFQGLKKNYQNSSGNDHSKKDIYQKVKKKIQMFCVDKKVRFKGLEEINIQNFNNYDDILNSNNKFSSMQALPELQSPIKSILRKKQETISQSVQSTPQLGQSKFTSKALKQLEGITQQRILPIKKKSLTQKNLILQQINSKS